MDCTDKENNDLDDDVVEIVLPAMLGERNPDAEPAPNVDLDGEQSNFARLRAMFPDVDENYVRQVCEHPPVVGDPGEDEFVLLVNHLLAYNEKVDVAMIEDDFGMEVMDETSIRDHELSAKLEMEELSAIQEKLDEEDRNERLLNQLLEREKLEEEARNEELLNSLLRQERKAVDEKMEILENILPEANPDELKRIVEINGEDSELIEEFVESKLVDRNYEKRAEYFAKLRSRMLIERFTTNFDVETFLKQFPEPVEHFESPSRQCVYLELAFKYLKSAYDVFNERYLNEKYTHFKFNLSLTINYLTRYDHIHPNKGLDHGIEDVPLLQEIAYIENKDEILEFLKTAKLKDEQELQNLRAQKLLLECQCCYDEMKPDESIECQSDGHLFCKRCIITGTNTAISNGETTVRCFMGCDNEIGLDILRKVLPADTFETFLKKRQDVEVMAANIPDLETCPFCPYVMELGPQIQLFMCKNPECKKISCRKCKKLNHLPIRCEDVLDEHKGRLFVEEEMTKGLIINCYNCQRPFVKADGCNMMTCSFCKAKWCHVCKQPIRGHSHFDTSLRCRNVNGAAVDVQRVNQNRDQAIQRLHQDFPDLKLPDL